MKSKPTITIFSLLILFLYAMMLASGGCSFHNNQDAPEQVVLLHGLGRKGGAMFVLQKRIREAGYQTHSIEYASLQEPPDVILEKVGEQIERCCKDDSGFILLKRCLDAANRGVRVRLIADGLILIGEGKSIAALDSHPNIEVRIFNPLEQQRVNRSLKSYQTLGDLIIVCTTSSSWPTTISPSWAGAISATNISA
jgi:hypothetical protein